MNKKLLLVEDDNTLATGIKYTLEKEGFECVHVSTYTDGLDTYNDGFELIIMDIELPDGNGYDLCTEIRKNSSIPIIFLTSYDDEVNIVMGLDLGADDYVTKPFQLKVLVSRIKANLRRPSALSNEKISVGNFAVDKQLCSISINNKKLDLTITEFKLLSLLISNANKTVTRQYILEYLWDKDGKFIDENTVSVHIRHIREKLDKEVCDAKIETARGIGYRLEV